MKPIRTFTVVPALPPALEPLRELAYNLRWAWDHDAIALFRWLGGPHGGDRRGARSGTDLWEETGRNPIRLLAAVDQSRLEAAAGDETFLARQERAVHGLRDYLGRDDTWFAQLHGVDAPSGTLMAYFSAEFGVADCLSIFAGGLGMLAGDHLKSASDLGIPLVGVGLLYQQGYFQQRLNEVGWQQEHPADNDLHTLPLTLERGADGEPIGVELGFPEGPLVAQVWRAQVGRVPLFMLDANVSANSPEQRRVTHHLYGGDDEMRIRQELLLGIGGFRALETLGYRPTVYHMNEGHSAFLGLELIRRLMDREAASFAEAREAASAALVFTTHTPVEAGHDYFVPQLLERYFAVYVRALGIEFRDFLGLGRVRPHDDNERFCMTVLALKLAAHCNAVSRLHGEVTRAMWRGLWPQLPEAEVPIGHVTNGVHLASWTSRQISGLYDHYLGTSWREQPGDEQLWRRLDEVAPEELWRLHELRRHKLVDFVRRRVRAQLEQRGASSSEVADAANVLDPDALTIGFARRFATYKRAALIASDPDRLARIMGDPHRPVQLIVAGKAHPRDDAGKELIRRIAELSRDDRFRGRVVFVEDYGMAVARYLVAGADVWLNNPVRPREASGTSGMKAAANGVLHLSTLDGWWDEAWHDLAADFGVPFGWAIGRADAFDDPVRHDHVDAQSLYDLLEHDVVPTFYERGEDGLPRSWIARMLASITLLTPCFNTHRMLREYTETLYLPASRSATALTADGLARARTLAAWRGRVTDGWMKVRCEVEAEDGPTQAEVRVGEQLRPRARVQLGGLSADDVVVELYIGRVGPDGEIADGHALPMQVIGEDGDGVLFEAVDVQTRASGQYGYTVRVRPRHRDLPGRFVAGCMTWANEDV
ncbi:MAG TPA: alpha-glucan family phosphorylase [Nitriliruptorales bacterium]|nr:alpha-glucan family phosphorylase [Nitriliruptorales bacterium]